MTEVWKPVVGVDHYEVSNLGRVRSWKSTQWGLRKSPRELKQQVHPKGYHQVSISPEPYKGVTMKVHRLVAEAFLGISPADRREVNHKDGNKSNNCADNLEWSNRSDNISHAYKNRLRSVPYGESNPNAKLTDDDVRAIRKSRGKIRQVDLAKKYGVPQTAISSVQLGKSWSHVT